MNHKIIEALNWRYATKKYDPAKKISAEDLSTLLEAVRMSVSSLGLQPYQVILVENPEIRSALRAAAFNQDAITEASHLFVFAANNLPMSTQIDNYILNISETRSVQLDSLEGFKKIMHNFVDGLADEARISWKEKQCYIAMANLISAASLLKIDATPMEGFDATKFDEILGLKQAGLHTAVIAAAGYRHPEDKMQHNKKVRKPKEELFIQL